MPYAFAPRALSSVGESRNLDVPLGDWAGLKFEAGARDTIYGSISRFTEDKIWDSGDTLRPDVATTVFGIPGYLKFDEPISIQRARLMRERKDEELRRMAYLNAATHSTFSLKAAVGLGAGMAGAISNPLDFSAMFVPFVGSERAAAGVAKLGRSQFQQRVARGLITTEEALGAATRFPRFGAAIINGAMGNAITEIPVFAQNVRDQAIYGPQDAALNVLLGGVTGGALHAAGSALGKLLRKAADTHSRLTPDEQDTALRTAVNQVLNDEPIDVSAAARLNRDEILRDLQFDEVAARQRALEAIGVLPEEAKARAIIDGLNRKQASAIDLLDLTRARANTGRETVEGKIAARLLERFQAGERDVSLFKQMADLFEMRYAPLAPTLQERLKADNLEAYFGDVFDGAGASDRLAKARADLAEVQAAVRRLEQDIAATTDKALKTRLTAFNLTNLKGKEARMAQAVEAAAAEFDRLKQPLDHDLLSTHAREMDKDQPWEWRAEAARLEAKADAIRAARVQELIAAERAKHEAAMAGKVSAAEAARLQQEIRAGKFMTDEEVASLTKDPTDEAGMAAIKDSIASLEAELKNVDPESPIATVVEMELKNMPEQPDIKKAFDAAADCLIRTL